MTTNSTKSRLLQALILALSTFPGRANRVILYLCGHISTDELLADTDGAPDRRRHLGNVRLAPC